MSQNNSLPAIVSDLIELMRLEAKELEKLVVHVEQVTSRLPEGHQPAFIVSELTALKARAKPLTHVTE